MIESRRLSIAAFTVLGTALAVTGCSSSTTSPAAPASEAAPSAAPSDTATALPTPPSGAEELSNKTTGDVQYARYQISGSSAQAVVDDYSSQAKSDGYTVTNSGSGGGGWGGWGGSGAGMSASKTGSYLDVQAGGESGGPTYFEVCMGPDESAVDQCDQNSQDDQQNQNQNQNDSNSKAS